MGERVGPAEVARLLSIAERTVRQCPAPGDLAGAVRVGKLWRFRLATFRAALEAPSGNGPAGRSPPPERARLPAEDLRHQTTEFERELRKIVAEIGPKGLISKAERASLASWERG